MLLLLLFNSYLRRSWNLGVTFLCFWLFVENVTNGVNAIIWADNTEIKLDIYCDIGKCTLSAVCFESDCALITAASLAPGSDHLCC